MGGKNPPKRAVFKRRISKDDIERRLDMLYSHIKASIRAGISTQVVTEALLHINIAAMKAASKTLSAEIKSGLIRETILTPLDDEDDIVDDTVEPPAFDEKVHIS